ncbi:methyltransferase, FxLD system [Micromonospora sp. CPCC 205558]|uniref:methyltransferase, FxLD system n=1 Tax=Micromonospora sp. CPCC 205558 TaxID=3122403 RepID=UPI002FF0ACDF
MALGSRTTKTMTAADARLRLVDQLRSQGWITRPEVAAAFTAVPRHLFAPTGTSIESAYANDVVVTRRGSDGKATSSISAPWLQAHMVETAGLTPGARVLEIGSGGYNAALIAEVVGPTGTVVSVDIDAQVVTHAQQALERAGYPQVEVVHADGVHGHLADGLWDAVLVTVEASDLPPAWTDQLAPAGRLVVPLRMRGNTRCLTLHSAGDHLAATASLQCGFVAMQGHGRNPARRVPLRGDDAVLTLDDDTTATNAEALRAALDGPRVEVASTVTLDETNMDTIESLHLWLASQPRPYGVLRVDRDRTAGLLNPQDRFFCPTLLTSDSLAYLTMDRHDTTTWQLGGHGFGPYAPKLTGDLMELTVAWDQQYRAGGGPDITVHPAGTRLPDTERMRLLVPRRHTLTAITWPETHH